MRRSLAFAGVLLVALTLSGCSALGTIDALTPEDGYQAQPSQAYGAHPRQRLDIYRPTKKVGSGPAPVIVFFYGGGWRAGDRADYRFVGQSFAAAGYVVAVADYRLWPEVRFPAFVEDGAAAVTWIQREIGRFDGDPNRIFLMGHSAGAHLVTMLHADRRFLDQAGFRRPADGGPGIAGTIGLAGPYAFEPTGRFAEILNADGGRPFMPGPLVEGREPPLLLLHGETDMTVGVSNTRKFSERVRAAGGSVDTVYYTMIGHGPIVAALADPLRWLGPVREDILNWLKRQNPV